MAKKKSTPSSSGGLGVALETLTHVASWAKRFLEGLGGQLHHQVERLARRLMGLILLTVLMAAGSVFFVTGALLFIAETTGSSVGLVFGIGGAFLCLVCALILALRGR